MRNFHDPADDAPIWLTPVESEYQSLPKHAPPLPEPGMVAQVPLFGVLSILQGVGQLLAGFYNGAYGLLYTVLTFAPQEGHTGNVSVEHLRMLGMLYGGLGAAAIIAGLVRIFAGYRNYNYCSRNWGLLAMGTDLLAAPLCVCVPSGVALWIYGLAVLLNAQVRQAFNMRAEGRSVQEIRRAFSLDRPRHPHSYPKPSPRA